MGGGWVGLTASMVEVSRRLERERSLWRMLCECRYSRPCTTWENTRRAGGEGEREGSVDKHAPHVSATCWTARPYLPPLSALSCWCGGSG